MKNKYSKLNALKTGFEFTSLVLSPILIFIVGGRYVQLKNGFDDDFFVVCVLLSMFFIVFNTVIMFIRVLKGFNKKAQKGENDEGKK